MTPTPDDWPCADLDRTECLDLLRPRSIGRIAIHRRALPLVVPVRYALLGETVVLRLPRDELAEGAVRGAVVAFEVDEIDPFTMVGWYVGLTGVPRHVPATASEHVDAGPCSVAIGTGGLWGRRTYSVPTSEGGSVPSPIGTVHRTTVPPDARGRTTSEPP